VPGPDHAGRLRGDLPRVQPGLLRVLRAAGTPNTNSLVAELKTLGMAPPAIQRLLRTFNANAPAFKAASEAVIAEAKAP